MLIKVNEDGSTIYPYNIKSLKREYPDTTFPKMMTDEQLESFSIFNISVITPPELYTTVVDDLGDESQKIVIPEGMKLAISSPELIDGKWIVNRTLEDKLIQVKRHDFELDRKRRLDKIRGKFSIDSLAPIEDANGVIWDSGFDTAVKLDAAMRLSESMGATEVTFYDSVNDAHVLTMAEAKTVIQLVAIQYQSLLATKQSEMKAITDEVNPFV